MNERAAETPEPVLGATLRRVADAALKLLSTRLELASIELAEAQRALLRWVAFSLAAGLLLLLAAIAATAAVVIALWGLLGWVGLAIFALAYTIIAIVLLRRVQREVAASPGVLAATTAELREDLAQLARPRDAQPGEAR